MGDATSQNGNGNGTGQGDQGGGQGTGNSADKNAGAGGDNNGAGAGTQGDSNSSAANFDPSKLEAKDLEKVLENPDLWKTPRMQELLKGNKELQELKKKQQEDADKKLADDKKWEELAQKRDDELKTERKRNQELQVSQALANKLSPAGVVDLDGALKLIDRSKVEVKDDGSISGIDEAIEALKTDKAYLFKAGNGGTVGTATNSGNGTGNEAQVTKFKRSQLQNPAFYQENRAEILKAAAAGQIEDDVSPHR